jgi:hypothetical protein
MEGENRVRLLNKPEDGVYSISVRPSCLCGLMLILTDAQHVRSRDLVRQDGPRAR